MKNQRSLFRARSPDLNRNKLSDHTSHPRKHSRNQGADHRRSSQGGPFSNKTLQIQQCNTSQSPPGKHDKSTTKGTLLTTSDKVTRRKFIDKIDKLKRELDELRRISLLSELEPVKKVKHKGERKARKQGKKLLEKVLPPRKSSSKKKLDGGKNRDFVLVGHQILAIQNSDQLEDLLRQRKVQEESLAITPKKTLTRPLATLEKYFQTFLQCIQYQQDLKASVNNLDVLLFHVKDLSKPQRLQLYHQLKSQVSSTPLPTTPTNFQSLLRESIRIIQRKHHLAKLILDKVELKQDYNDKLNKLNLWKSKRFREIMTCKTFIDLNRAKKEAEEEQMDPLKKLGAMLQLEFDELVGEKFYRAINNSRMIDAGVVMNKVEEEIQKERDTFVLENPEFIPNKLIEEIKRVKEIKDAVKGTIDKRISSQLGQGVMDQMTITQPSGIQTNLMAVNTYLVKLIQFILQNYQKDFLLNIKKCYGMNIVSKLKMARNMESTEPVFNQILSNQMFVEFEQQVIGIGKSQSEKKLKYFQHIHNKAIYDLLNFYLNTFRPFYANGQPLPWKSNSQFISSFLINQDNQADVLENARFSVLSVLEHLCGVLVESVDERLLPQDLTSPEQKYVVEILREALENNNSERMRLAVNQDVIAYVKQANFEIFQVNVQARIAAMLFDELVAEAIGEFF